MGHPSGHKQCYRCGAVSPYVKTSVAPAVTVAPPPWKAKGAPKGAPVYRYTTPPAPPPIVVAATEYLKDDDMSIAMNNTLDDLSSKQTVQGPDVKSLFIMLECAPTLNEAGADADLVQKLARQSLRYQR